MNHTHQAWLAALPGMWGVTFDHAPDHEVTGAYLTESEAWERIRAVEQAQPGVRGWVVRK